MKKAVRQLIFVILTLSLMAGVFAPALAQESQQDPPEWIVAPINNAATPTVAVTNDLVAATEMVKVTNPGMTATGTGTWTGFKLTSPEGFSIMLQENTTSFTFDLIYSGPGTTNRAFNVEVAGFDAAGARVFYDMQAAGTATNNQPATGWRQIAINSVVSPGGKVVEVTKLEIAIRLSNTAYNETVYLSGFRVGTIAIPAAYIANDVHGLYTNKVTLGPDKLSIPTVVGIADSKATPTTRALFAYLYAVGQSDYTLWGIQNPYNTPSTSPPPAGRGYPGAMGNDFHDIAGIPVSIIGFDGLSFFQHERYSRVMTNGGTWADRNARVAGNIETTVQQSTEYNAIVHLSLHMPNFGRLVDLNPTASTPADYYALFNNAFGNYANEGTTNHWGCRVLNGNTMQRILPGGDANAAYNVYLDLIADYALGLQAEDVSFIFRPFHEFNGNFFWWGAPYTTPEGFKNAWRYTIDYLRDKGVHNALYCYNFNHRVTDEINFERYYPGDSYVDIVSFDRYSGADDQWRESIHIMSNMADERGKIVAVAEYGGNGNAATAGGFQTHAQLVFESLGRNRATGERVPGINGKTAWMMIWHQGGGGSYPNMTSTTRGAAGVPTFIRDFVNSDYSVFGDGSMSFKQLSELNAAVRPPLPQGWVVNPIADSFVDDAVTVQVVLVDATGPVTVNMVSGGKTVSRAAPLNAETGYYEAAFTQAEIRANLPSGADNAFGKFEVVVGGAVIGYTQVLFGPSFAKLNNVVDTFELYSGCNDILNSFYRKRGTADIELSLQQDYLAPGSEYGLKYDYVVTPDRNAVTPAHPAGTTEYHVGFMLTRTMPNGTNPNLAAANAIQFYMKPDGNGQKVVVRAQTVNGEREFYLTNFARTTEPMIVTIPFSSFGGMVTGHTGNDFNVTASAWSTVAKWRQLSEFGIFVNPLSNQTTKVEGTLYFDDIRFVTLSASELAALDLSYASNGLQQGAHFEPAPVVAAAGLRGPGEFSNLEEPLDFNVWLTAEERDVNTIEVRFAVNDGLDQDSIEIEILDAISKLGFEVVDFDWGAKAAGKVQGRLTLGIRSGGMTVEDFLLFRMVDILKLSFDGVGPGAEAVVTLDSVILVSHFGNQAKRIVAYIAEEDATVKSYIFSKYDLNRDGVVDVIDMGIALLATGWSKDDIGWDTFAISIDMFGKAITPARIDVNASGAVDMLDILDIIINYTGW